MVHNRVAKVDEYDVFGEFAYPDSGHKAFNGHFDHPGDKAAYFEGDEGLERQ